MPDPLVPAPTRRTRRRRQPTIIEVAASAGVSVSTVSRVLRNRDDVSDETRSRVRRVIEELGYRPSGVARALVTGYSRTIALLVSDIANPFYPQLAKSVEQEARKAGYAMAICNTSNSVDESAAYIHRLLEQGVDGFIHASVGPDEERVLELIPDRRRIVFLNRRPRSRDVSYVVADNRKAATILVRHLVDRHHGRVGFISGPSWAANARERLEGFFRTTTDLRVDAVVADGDFSMASGMRAVDDWLASGHMPTAIIAVNDTVALGAISRLLDRAALLPIAVAGFDDIDLVGSPIVGLTSVAQHIDKMGSVGVRLLLRQMGDQIAPPVRRILEPTLHVRRSTAEYQGSASNLTFLLASQEHRE